MNLGLWVLLGVVLLPAVWALAVFNRLVALRNRLKEAWSGIDVQLKRRRDLVPNLVEAVKGYQAHERKLLEDLTAHRTAALGAQGVAGTGRAENDLARDLKALVAVAEAYPDLKADRNYRQLFDALVEVEDHLQYARRYYNGTVRDLNILVESFPSLLVARVAGFASAEFFEVEAALERQAPEVRT